MIFFFFRTFSQLYTFERIAKSEYFFEQINKLSHPIPCRLLSRKKKLIQCQGFLLYMIQKQTFHKLLVI